MGDIIGVFTELGIPLRYNDGTYRSLQDVLEDLSIEWNKLSDHQKDFISDIIEGE